MGTGTGNTSLRQPRLAGAGALCSGLNDLIPSRPDFHFRPYRLCRGMGIGNGSVCEPLKDFASISLATGPSGRSQKNLPSKRARPTTTTSPQHPALSLVPHGALAFIGHCILLQHSVFRHCRSGGVCLNEEIPHFS